MRETIEDIILRHSQRGMQVLRPYLPADFAKKAAEQILSWEKSTVLLTTGFYVAGFAETDGPSGIYVLATALRTLGYRPVIVTDSFCRGFFEPYDFEVVYVPMDADDTYFDKLLAKYKPVGMISSERCGINAENDYANMRGISIKEHTAPIDKLFAMHGSIPTIGVGDGGNEIGMGNLRDVITEKLSLVPCVVTVDTLVIASVSNWGAYGIAAYLQKLSGRKIFLTSDEVEDFLGKTVEIGSVDGITHERVTHVDGFDGTVHREILDALMAAAT